MAELIAGGPLLGRAPVEAAGCRLAALELGPVAAILPFPGGAPAVDAELRAQGLGLPGPGASVLRDGVRLLWSGRDAALLIGRTPPELAEAAVIDQTGGWAGLAVAGPGAEAVLARLVPIDLRAAAFPEGATTRTLLGHVHVLILRRAAGFELIVGASFARTAWQEVASAMCRLAARAEAAGETVPVGPRDGRQTTRSTT